MKGKKFFAWLLTAALVLGMLPVPAMAVSRSADVEISTLGQLKAFRNRVNSGDSYAGKTIVLTADIDLGGSENNQWTPIGSDDDHVFSGTFDGGGHKITGLYINNDTYYQGFFGCVCDGIVKNLGVDGTVSGGRYNVGGVLGYSGGTTTNCYYLDTCGAGGEGTEITKDQFADIGTFTGFNSDEWEISAFLQRPVLKSNPENSAGAGTGTEDDPYIIPDLATLKAFRDSVNGGEHYSLQYIKLTADIDLDGSENNQWTPIGSRNNYFSGTFDGGGHKITGLYIDNNSADNQGFFGFIANGGMVKNLGVEGTVTGKDYIGGVAARNVGGASVIENCYYTGTISGSSNVGGVAGHTTGTVKNCYNTSTVSGTEYVGGMVGHGTTTNCYYLDTCGAEGEGTSVTQEQFASGEVAYLLQKDQPEQVWGQTSGTGWPELTSDTAKALYKVAFIADSTEYAAAYANQNGTVILPADPVSDTLQFVQWSVGSEDGAAFTANTPVTADTTVYAKWTEKPPMSYTVTFDSQGGSAVSGQTVTEGETVLKPADPTRSGYTFSGWYKESGYTTAWDFETDTVTENITLYAKWTENQTPPAPVNYTVTFDSQGGSAVSSQTVAEGENVSKPAGPTRSGYTFGGWYKESGCITAWDFETGTVTENITLYAKWTAVNTPSYPSSSWNYNPPTYSITTPATAHGKVTVSQTNAARGTTVTITAVPEDGYRLGSINAISGGKDIALTEKGSGKYTFTMPAGTVRVEATFVLTETPGTPWINPFTDVAEGDWYYDAVKFVNERNLMNGYSDGRFGPNDNLSHAQLTQILFNKEGGPVVNYLMQYGDVSGNAWYAEAVRWATSQGIVSGYGNGNFGPNDSITREQLAVMLWRYSGSPVATNKELHFNDMDEISGFALDAMRWAVENGILSGYGDGRLGPKGLATRAQVAQMLMNFLKEQ